MSMTRVLFADDHLRAPPTTDFIRARIAEEYPGLPKAEKNRLVSEHKKHLQTTSKAVEVLKDGGYDVRAVGIYDDAIKVASTESFDIAIIDLGWYLEEMLPPADRAAAEWKICDALETADRMSSHRPTARIAYSSRFDDRSDLALRAARSHITASVQGEE